MKLPFFEAKLHDRIFNAHFRKKCSKILKF